MAPASGVTLRSVRAHRRTGRRGDLTHAFHDTARFRSITTFDAWFGAGVSAADKSNNVGRRMRELAITYLPNYLLHKYCSDVANGKTHATGEVFDTLSLNYTVAQLEAQNLWTRMDAKIAAFGGCAHVP